MPFITWCPFAISFLLSIGVGDCSPTFLVINYLCCRCCCGCYPRVVSCHRFGTNARSRDNNLCESRKLINLILNAANHSIVGRVVNSLIAEFVFDVVELTVNVLVEIEKFGVRVGICITELYFSFKFCYSCRLSCLIAIYGHIFGCNIVPTANAEISKSSAEKTECCACYRLHSIVSNGTDYILLGLYQEHRFELVTNSNPTPLPRDSRYRFARRRFPRDCHTFRFRFPR